MKIQYTREWLKKHNWHFDQWFDKDKFNWSHYPLLIQNCHEHFDKWFDPQNMTMSSIECKLLIMFCSEHFEKWFDTKTFVLSCRKYLPKYCPNHKHIWNPALNSYFLEQKMKKHLL
jgi:hypothetical protein